MFEKLETWWMMFVKELGADVDVAHEAFTDVLYAQYSAPTRGYHSISHIDACLRIKNKLVPEDKKIDPYVEMAIWWHDLVYIPTRPDNEEKSAFEFQKWGRKMGLQEKFIADVADMIPYTKHNAELQGMADRYLYLVDVDLSILGEDKETFDAYEEGVRFEYAFVPEDVFRSGRAAILQQFLDRPVIYETEAFRSAYERRARENLQRSIQRLGGQRRNA